MNKKFKIIYVEDEIVLVNDLIRILDGEDVEIIRFSDGLSCLNNIESIADIDLMLIDIRMPIMDGLELCKELNDKNINIPRYVVTALCTHEELQTARKYANGIMVKPLKHQEIMRILNNKLF